ncbi:hypothetical protein THAOC_35893 [Thalassiosira oceanica]|uniref:Uncharacterized protein n=1 Tax=Thalassiosira oceanica TaxID=159749 RepID=K0R997_THAOC|nr:hypothetical protein THAOC_35893 [Thalassiosira oceanica]|eukprot:EJK45491.1 hypothetical protein THAOC_35893 [Thalassiosira oceanica]
MRVMIGMKQSYQKGVLDSKFQISSITNSWLPRLRVRAPPGLSRGLARLVHEGRDGDAHQQRHDGEREAPRPSRLDDDRVAPDGVLGHHQQVVRPVPVQVDERRARPDAPLGVRHGREHPPRRRQHGRPVLAREEEGPGRRAGPVTVPTGRRRDRRVGLAVSPGGAELDPAEERRGGVGPAGPRGRAVPEPAPLPPHLAAVEVVPDDDAGVVRVDGRAAGAEGGREDLLPGGEAARDERVADLGRVRRGGTAPSPPSRVAPVGPRRGRLLGQARDQLLHLALGLPVAVRRRHHADLVDHAVAVQVRVQGLVRQGEVADGPAVPKRQDRQALPPVEQHDVRPAPVGVPGVALPLLQQPIRRRAAEQLGLPALLAGGRRPGRPRAPAAVSPALPSPARGRPPPGRARLPALPFPLLPPPAPLPPRSNRPTPMLPSPANSCGIAPPAGSRTDDRKRAVHSSDVMASSPSTKKFSLSSSGSASSGVGRWDRRRAELVR